MQPAEDSRPGGFDSVTQSGRRLDEMQTHWTMIRQAHDPADAASREAMRRLVLRYQQAIRRYVGAMLRSDDQADEVVSDIIVKLLQGDFARATPQRGRFRDLLKVSVRNIVCSRWAKQKVAKEVAYDPALLPDQADDACHDSEDWLSDCRKAVLTTAWSALEAFEQRSTGSFAFTVLRLKADRPQSRSEELARVLAEQTGRPWTAEAFRKQLQRARREFARCLVDEVRNSLEQPSPAAIEEELVDLGLLEFVKDFLPPDWRERGVLAE